QAEDGIRVLTVTVVQTCALPISPGVLLAGAAAVLAAFLLGRSHGQPEAATTRRTRTRRDARGRPARRGAAFNCRRLDALDIATRSEERRVGKEGRDRWGRVCGKW